MSSAAEGQPLDMAWITRATSSNPSSPPATDMGNTRMLGKRLSSDPTAPSTILGKRKREDDDDGEQNDDEPSPEERVFGLTELLEHILLYLPPADILRLQSVNSNFKDAHTSSKQLQLKTFKQIHRLPVLSFSSGQSFNGFPPQMWDFNPLLLGRKSKNVHEQIHITPPMTPHGKVLIQCRMDINLAPSMNVTFGEAHENDEIDDAQIRPSWTDLHLYDSVMPIRLLVILPSKLVDFGLVVMAEIYRREVNVSVRNCSLGNLLGIAVALKGLSSFDCLFTRDRSVDRKDHELCRKHIPNELMELLEGPLRFLMHDP